MNGTRGKSNKVFAELCPVAKVSTQSIDTIESSKWMEIEYKAT